MGEHEDSTEQAVARLAQIGACWSPSFAPDGQRLAFISNLNGLPQVWTVAVAGGWPELVTALPDQIAAVLWSPDGEWLAFQLAPGGGLNQQIWLMRPDGSELRRLTEGGKDNNWLGLWSHDGRRLAIASSRRSPDAMDAYLVDIASGEQQLLSQNNGIGTFTDLSRDGRYAALYRMESRSDDNMLLVDTTSGDEVLLTPHEGSGSFDNGRFTADSSAVYFSSNAGRELRAFARSRLDERERPGPIEVLAERPDAELQAFELADDGTVALLWNIAGRNELWFWDPQTLQHTPGPQLAGEIVHELSFSQDGQMLALVISGASLPRDIWILHRGTAELRQLTHSPHAGVRLSELVRPEAVSFVAHDGLALSGWLYRPPGAAEPGPLVLSFHGGPEGQERPLFNSTYQALLSNGIAVLAPNVRGSSGFGKTFVNLDNGALRVDAVRDIRACVEYVLASGVAAAGRIGIMGGSYGGYMTMAGLVEYPELFAAGANLYGIVNFETFFAHTEPWMAAISTVEYGDPHTERELLRSLSPIHRIERVSAPTIVLHGANDTNVPVVEAEQLVQTLERRGVPVEYVLFADEGHGFLKTPNRIRAAVAITRWFARYL